MSSAPPCQTCTDFGGLSEYTCDVCFDGVTVQDQAECDLLIGENGATYNENDSQQEIISDLESDGLICGDYLIRDNLFLFKGIDNKKLTHSQSL